MTEPLPESGEANDATAGDAAPVEAAESEAADALSGQGASLEPVTRSDEQLYILQVRLKDWVLSDGMFGYLDSGGLLLPLGELARALEFPISVDPVEGRASGWFLSENRLFSLDLARREVVVEGRRGSYNPRFVELHEEDIYVDTRVLLRWFPVDIDFDLSNSLVRIRSREPLPVEQRLEREQVRGALAGRRGVSGPVYEEIETPYAWASRPFVDTFIEAGYRRDATGEGEAVGRYNSLFTADLLKMSASMFVAGNQDDPLTQARLTLGRKDPLGRLFGPLHATEFSMGDISSPQMTLISDPHFGRGAEISSFPLGQEAEFDRTTLIGDLPIGWDVELYRNEVLIDFQSARQDGRYEFTDVPLLFGVNVLRLEFFGPQGQRRQETRRILVGSGQVAKGKLNYRLAANQHDTDLFPVEDELGGVPAPETEGEARLFAQVEYGLTRSLALAGGVSSIPLVSGRRTYGTAGVRLSLGASFTELDLVGDDQGGMAVRLGSQFSLPGNLGLLLEHSQFSDYVSEDAEDISGLLESRSKARLDGVIAAGSLPRVPFSVSASHEKYEAGREELEIENRLSAAVRRLAVSNNLSWRTVTETGIDTVTADGTLLVGGRAGRAYLRGEARYDLEPDAQMSGAGLTGDWYFNTDLSARMSVQSEFTDPRLTTYQAGISKRFPVASVGVTAQYASDESASAMLTVSFGLGREPRGGSWQGSADPMAAKGSVSARAFLDRNFDGIYNEGDEPIEGLRLETNRGLPRQTTDAEGIVLLSGLPVYETVDVALRARNLEDPYWVARPEGYSMILRPGQTAVADFPVVTTGEIDGTVYLVSNGVRREVAEVGLQLVDDSGKTVDTVQTAFDGFYLFGSVLPGSYSVRVDEAQLARLNLAASEPRRVTIGGDGTVASNVSFMLYRVGEGAPKAR